MSGPGTDYNARQIATACQWCGVPKKSPVPGWLLCSICDIKALLLAEDTARRKSEG